MSIFRAIASGSVVAVGTVFLQLCLPSSKAYAALYRLPWDVSSGDWQVTGEWHGSFDNNMALDFDSITFSKNLRILAPADGTITEICTGSPKQTWVHLKTPAGIFKLLHLATDSVHLQEGQSVKQGDLLGKLYEHENYFEDSCGESYRTHLHFVFPKTPFTIDGYVFDKSIDYTGDLFRSTNSIFDTFQAEKDIKQAYQDILGRDPDSTRLSIRIDELKAGEKTLAQLRKELANGSEATSLINTMYKDILDRNPTSDKLQDRRDDLADGGTLSKLRKELAYSQEAANAIKKIYRNIFDEVPSSELIKQRQNYLVDGNTLSGLQAYLVNENK
ncbi:MAG: M23 family metallopeptidase, partial [Leptolyngbya sp. SIO4C5]|nr:M23 family metallopeptidase [Leptolyngbya sp. SIO4C5]